MAPRVMETHTIQLDVSMASMFCSQVISLFRNGCESTRNPQCGLMSHCHSWVQGTARQHCGPKSSLVTKVLEPYKSIQVKMLLYRNATPLSNVCSGDVLSCKLLISLGNYV